jgi:hypothetical protein
MTVQQFSFITPLFFDTCRHTKNKSWRRCRLCFPGKMQCWWIFDFETDYKCILHFRKLGMLYNFEINCTYFFHHSVTLKNS